MRRTFRGRFVAAAIVMAVLSAGLVPATVSAEEDAPVGEAEQAGDETVREIKMVARNWFWDPDRIRVKKGTRLVLHIEGFDAPHAFHLKPYGLKVPVREGETVTVEFVADKVGEFVWRCSRPCGNGCSKMRGTLVVVD